LQVSELGGSQVSPESTRPLPHASIMQVPPQPSPSTPLPSSHSSPGSRTPLPHAAGGSDRQVALQRAVSGGSHSSSGSSRPLPHTSIKQSGLQPSAPSEFPSSHSSRSSRTPFPQPVGTRWQSWLQLPDPGGSQSSPESMIRSPQCPHVPAHAAAVCVSLSRGRRSTRSLPQARLAMLAATSSNVDTSRSALPFSRTTMAGQAI
jgi:hypothetical protein